MARPFRKVVVLGLDGLEPAIVERLIHAGLMPNLASLRARGGLSRVATTAPAQTPVAWSSFATGVNPGGHGIFDFLRRDPARYLPDLALNRYERKNAFTPPRAVNLRRGTPVWSILADAGIPSAVVRCPCTYPPDPVKGRLLAGMGVPDLRGSLGVATFYTTAEGVRPGEAERVVRLDAARGAVPARLIGPRNPKDGADTAVEFTLEPDPAGGRARFRCAGASPGEVDLVQGEWSGWIRVKFKLGLLQSVRGMVRLLLLRTGDELTLYASPVNFDPDAPLFPISAPAEYAGDLAAELGPFYTTGMVEDHAGLSNGRLDEAAFLAQCDLAWREREAMMLRELAALDEGLFYCLFDTPDRVQHMFWRFTEPDHPANHARSTDLNQYANVIEETYRRADEAVGKALEFVDDQTLTIALSDHGFGSFQRCVDLNGWLLEKGLLALKADHRPGEDSGDLLRGIDWARTRAYAVGLGGIYLNLKGREGSGIVDPAEADALKAEIARELGGLADPERNATAVRRVVPREELYRGPYVEEAPDLLTFFERGYRVSWGTSMGAVGPSTFEDNTNAWGGDHIVDPELVPGVLLMDRPFQGEGARLIDLAPTILQALGLPPGPAMEGQSLR